MLREMESPPLTSINFCGVEIGGFESPLIQHWLDFSMVVFNSIRSSGIVAAKLLSKKYFEENRRWILLPYYLLL